MSRHSAPTKRSKTTADLQKAKQEGRKLSAITCYDSAFAKLISRTEVDLVLVGDSMGNVVLGFDNTIPVTVDMICHHTAAVSRQLAGPLLCADMPFLSYHQSVDQALENAGRMLQQGGAHAVKLEGGQEVVPQVQAMVQAGIPVLGHLGYTPQSVNVFGGHKVQGREQAARDKLKEDAIALQEAGVFAIVFELIPRQLAAEVTQSLRVPTIGIGAGPECDGQIIVLHDILGFDDEFQPKFLKKYANLAQVVTDGVGAYDKEVKSGEYPAPEHCYE